MKSLGNFIPIKRCQHLGWLTSSVLLLLAASSSAVSAQTVLFNETFTNPTTAQFTSGGNACLTASQNTGQPSVPGCDPNGAGATVPGTPSFGLPAGGDAATQGALRLTSNNNDATGFVLSTQTIASGQGLAVTFDLFSYGGNGADGIGFFLTDGNAARPVQPGGTGGSFGYAPRNIAPPSNGIDNGYVGLAFDEYGNFSANTEGRQGGMAPGRLPQSVSLRGAAGGGYSYLAGTGTNFAGTTVPPGSQFDTPAATNRGAVTPRRVRIRLSPTNQLSVEIDFNNTGNFIPVIPAFDLNKAGAGQPLPSSFYFGFSGSTGTSVNVHEIRNLLITVDPPDLRITKNHVGNFTVGQRGVYTLGVQNAPSAGRTTGPVTVSDNLPAGLTFVSGTGTNWSCSAVGQLVTCTYSGPTVGPGDTLPNITLTVNVTAAASPSTTNTATVSVAPNTGGAPVPTPGAPNPGGSSSTPDVAVVSPGPALTPNKTVTNASGSGSANPGDVLTYTVVISNTGTLPANGTRFTDSVPANTTYIPNSTRLNNNAVPDVAGNQPFPLTNGTLINSPNAAAGVINVNQAATVTFQVRINQPLPSGVTQITNQGSVSSNEVTTPVPTNQVVTPIAGLTPNLRLVKRITAIRRGGIATSFNDFVNDPSDPNATAAGFAQLSPVGVFSIGPETTLQSGDEVEYTIYFLSDGSSPQNNVRLCDPVSIGTTFIPDSFGAGQGVLVNRAGTSTPQSNSSDFVSPLAPLPPGNVCSDSTNRNGSVLVNLGNISNTAGSNFGFFRFRVRID